MLYITFNQIFLINKQIGIRSIDKHLNNDEHSLLDEVTIEKKYDQLNRQCEERNVNIQAEFSSSNRYHNGTIIDESFIRFHMTQRMTLLFDLIVY